MMTPNYEKIFDKAVDILGSKERAEDWMDKTSATLGGSPAQLSETDEGTLRVLHHLTVISRHSFQ